MKKITGIELPEQVNEALKNGRGNFLLTRWNREFEIIIEPRKLREGGTGYITVKDNSNGDSVVPRRKYLSPRITANSIDYSINQYSTEQERKEKLKKYLGYKFFQSVKNIAPTQESTK